MGAPMFKVRNVSWSTGWIVALALAGVWVSGELLKQHDDLWSSAGATGGLLARMCAATAAVGLDCEAGRHGPWSVVKVPVPTLNDNGGWPGVRAGHVPVAFAGLSYFAFMAIWFGFLGSPRPWGSRWYAVPCLIGLAGMAGSLWFVAVMLLGMAPRCLLCFVTHAINLALVPMVWRVSCRVPKTAGHEADAAIDPHGVASRVLTARQVCTVAAFAMMLVAGLWGYRSQMLGMKAYADKLRPYNNLVRALKNDPAFLLREYYAEPAHAMTPRLTADPSATSAEDHPGVAQLTVFLDYQCGLCYCSSVETYRQAKAAFGGKLRVVVRHFPLSEECNPAVTGSPHPQACDAAYAAEAARMLGGENAFAAMNHWLFAHQDDLSDEAYMAFADEIGLDTQAFEKAMNGPVVRGRVAADVALAQRLGVKGTPMMFLNGRKIKRQFEGPVFWRTVAQDWYERQRRAEGDLRADGYWPIDQYSTFADASVFQ